MVCSFLPVDGCQEKANAVIDVVVNYVKAVPSQKVCGKFLDCGTDPEPTPGNGAVIIQLVKIIGRSLTQTHNTFHKNNCRAK